MAARTVVQLALTFAVVTRLSPETAGLWFLFVSAGSVAQLFDMGMAAAVMRSAGHLFAGVKKLQAQGVDRSEVLEGPNHEGLKNLMATVTRVYNLLALGVLLLALVVAFTVFGKLTDEVSKLAWMCYAVGVALQLMVSQRYNFLQGVGRLVKAQKIMVVGALLSWGGAALALLLTSSLLWACAAWAAGSLLQLVLYIFSLGGFKGGKLELNLLATLWPNCWRGGLSRLSFTLAYNLPTLVIAETLGVIAAGQYGFTMQVFLFINAIAQLPITAANPRVNELAARGELPTLRGVFFQKIRQMFVLYALLIVGLLVTGPWILQLVHSKTHLLPLPLLAGLAAFFLLENHRNNHVILVWAFNHFPFWKYDIASGLAAVGGSFFVLKFAGLPGFILWLWVVQLSWSFWWPVRQGLKMLECPWKDYEHGVFKILKNRSQS